MSEIDLRAAQRTIARLYRGGVVAEVVLAHSAPASLTDEEAALVEGAVEERRAEFNAGRYCARRALGKLGYDSVAILRDERRAPRWPVGVAGSIAHSSGLCAAVVASTAKVAALGLDMEPWQPLSLDLAGRICSDADRDTLSTRSGEDAGLWLRAVFTCKEAFYKFQYPQTREFLGLRDASVDLDLESGTYELCIHRALGPWAAGTWFSGTLAVQGGFIFSGLGGRRET
jgi:4'-phosphopantetheinyl transferase EntD